MLSITPDTGVFLSLVVQACKTTRILEIGTSNGYSTIWLAMAAEKVGGTVTTIEIQTQKVEKAKANFARAKLESRIHLIHGDAGAVLSSAPANQFDFIFLDSDRERYAQCWNDLVRVLAPGGLLVVDNAVSHDHELVDFNSLVAQSKFENSLVPIGKGERLILKPLQ